MGPWAAASGRLDPAALVVDPDLGRPQGHGADEPRENGFRRRRLQRPRNSRIASTRAAQTRRRRRRPVGACGAASTSSVAAAAHTRPLFGRGAHPRCLVLSAAAVPVSASAARLSCAESGGGASFPWASMACWYQHMSSRPLFRVSSHPQVRKYETFWFRLSTIPSRF